MAQAAADVRSAGLALFLLIKKKKPYQRIGGIHMLPNLEELKKQRHSILEQKRTGRYRTGSGILFSADACL